MQHWIQVGYHITNVGPEARHVPLPSRVPRPAQPFRERSDDPNADESGRAARVVGCGAGSGSSMASWILDYKLVTYRCRRATRGQRDRFRSDAGFPCGREPAAGRAACGPALGCRFLVIQ